MNAELYKEKYRVATTRLPEWNYANDGFYFITICEYAMREYFGDVKNEKMILSPIGEIVGKCWWEIPDHFPFVMLDEFVVMPNHVHGLVQIVGTNVPHSRRDAINRVSTFTQNAFTHDAVRLRGGITGKHNPMGQKTLGEIIRWFKGKCSFVVHRTTDEFKWQSRFYDTVIRDQKSLNNIRQYIRTNPERWHRDRNNFKNEFTYHD